MSTTIVEQKSFRNRPPKLSTRRRNKTTVNIKQPSQTIVVQQQPNRRTLRNRRRRMRQRLMRVNPFSESKMNYWHKYFVNIQGATENSVHKAIQTLFYPTHGIHRGISNGMESSAITWVQGSTSVSVGTAAAAIVFNFTPQLVTAPQQAYPAFFAVGVGTSYADAVTQMTGLGASTPGPLNNNNPTREYRVVSATLNIIPIGQLLSRGGGGKIGYSSTSTIEDFTNTAAIENLAIAEAWDGLTAMSLHWVPNTDEQYFATNTSVISRSALLGYLSFQTNSSNSFRFEWQVGVEYIPTVAVRPFVLRQPPEMTFDTYYYINKVVMKHWAPLMIDTLDGYRKRELISLEHSLGGHSDRVGVHISTAGTSGTGFGNTPEMADLDDDSYEDIAPSLGSRVLNAAKQTACTVSRAYGLDICSPESQSTAFDIGVKQLRRAGQGGYRSRTAYQGLSEVMGSIEAA